MSKPEDIPQNVWDRAFYHLDDFGLVGALYDEDEEHLVLRCISSAILAAKAEERRECIATVLGFVRYSDSSGGTSINPYADAQQIAAAIRKRGEASRPALPLHEGSGS